MIVPPSLVHPHHLQLLLLRWAATEPTCEAALHGFHALLLSLLLMHQLLFQPLLSILPDLLLQSLVVLLASLPRLILQHLALRESLCRRLLAINHHHHAPALDPQSVAERAQPGVFGPLLLLFLDLLLELGSRDGLPASEFRRDVRACERSDGFSHVRVGHGVDILEEGDQGDEFFVFDVALPGFQNDGIIRLLFSVRCFRINDDDFGEIAVEV